MSKPEQTQRPPPPPPPALPWRLLAPLAILLGIGLRLERWLEARSLWADEARLALNILERGYLDLARPLDMDQSAPYLFLALTRLVTSVAGSGERALRLVPFLAGCLALAAAGKLAARLLPRRSAWVAVLVVALGEPAIYYTSELKPYAVDMLVAVLLGTGALGLAREGPTRRRLAWLALLGLLGMGLSHPAVFGCAGVAAGLAVTARPAGGPRLARRHALGLGSLWALGFAVLWLLVLRHQTGDYLARYWEGSFAPAPLGAAALRWYARALWGLAADPLGLRLGGLGAALLLAGLVDLARRDRPALAILLGPLAATLAASGLGLYPFPSGAGGAYPFPGRLLLFLVPALALLVARGLELIAARGGGRRGVVLAGILLASLLAHPALRAARHATSRPVRHQELRPVLQEMAASCRDGDRLLLYFQTEPAFRYYRPRTALASCRLDAPRLLPSRGDFARELPRLLAFLAPGDRVWVVYTHHPLWTSEAESRLLGEELERRGTLLAASLGPGAAARLYRIGPGRPRPAPP